MKMKRICIFCGSNSGNNPEYLKQSKSLGTLLANKGIEIVYGGANVGLMGAIADSALAAGGKVIGVIPELLQDKIGHNNLTKTIVVANMHERKRSMFELSDGFIALPGGIGTLEEFFEIQTWSQLGIHSKPCGLFNIQGYYKLLMQFIEQSMAQNFIKKEYSKSFIISDNHDDLLDQLHKYQAPKVLKWIS